MMATLGDLLARRDTPVLLLLAVAVLLAASLIARKAFASQARQGKRLGTIERLMQSERTRRRQVEQVLREQGIELPYWPDDPAELHGITAIRRSSYYSSDDLPAPPYLELPTAEAERPPVPDARHRR
jgi:hypothetical protein